MIKVAKVLLLAGTSEAAEIAAALVGRRDVAVQASMAGATRAPRDLGVPMRLGGFGGEDAFRDYLTEQGIEIVVDATHPFATRISTRTAKVCAEMGVGYVLVQRPGWTPQAGDRWHFVDTMEQIRKIVPPASRVFLATGRNTLQKFEILNDCRILCRVIDPPRDPFPFAHGRFVVGRPPFSVAQEIAFFTQERIDWIVVKNSGGSRSESKLVAARQLGLPVILINRTPPPDCTVVETVDDCLRWLDDRLAK